MAPGGRLAAVSELQRRRELRQRLAVSSGIDQRDRPVDRNQRDVGTLNVRHRFRFGKLPSRHERFAQRVLRVWLLRRGSRIALEGANGAVVIPLVRLPLLPYRTTEAFLETRGCYPDDRKAVLSRSKFGDCFCLDCFDGRLEPTRRRS